MLKETDIAYIAGILDGEGSIELVAKKGEARWAYPQVSIGNTSKELIDWLFLAIPNGNINKRKTVPKNRKQDWTIRWWSITAIELLRSTLPYLKIKRARAELVIELWDKIKTAEVETGGRFYRHNPLPEDLAKQKEDAYWQMRQLNLRGVH